MIGRLNHVAIAVPDLAAAAAQYRDTLGARRRPAAGPARARRHRGLRRAPQHQDRAARIRSATPRRSRAFSPRTPPAASITSATRSPTSPPPATG